jgi:hypothetical protein
VSPDRPFLQLIAFGEDIEIQEMSLSFLRKGKGREEEPVLSQAEIGGTTGFLCGGGNWDQSMSPHSIFRSLSISSAASATSFDSLDSEDIATKMRMEEGIYGWCQKGNEDWRVFWVGGTVESEAS